MGFAPNMLIATAAIATVASLGFAETATAPTSPGGQTQVVSPRWNNGGASLASPDELLTQTVMAIPQASADAVAARWTYRRVNRELSLTSNFMRNDFRESPEYGNAMDELQEAYDAYEAARRDATRKLYDSIEYQAAEELRQNIGGKIADEHEQKEPDHEKLMAMARLKLGYITPYRAVERNLLANNTNVARARTRLINATRAASRLERDFARQVRDSIELAELRRTREDARATMLASSAFLREMKVAREFAADYAFRSKRYNRYIPRLAGYGYGYGGYRFGAGLGVGLGYPVISQISH